jgi:hypothetical protein
MILRYLILAACSVAASAMVQNAYVKAILVANDPKYHPQFIDRNMVDAWSIAIRPPGAGGHFWISNAATGTSVEYISDVNGPLYTRTGSRPSPCRARNGPIGASLT